ncbi:hypothetical protein [Arthrobacter sp. H35-D1]|uniref:hypothetical protein n=1 Tax=Arthrobacter sp. H35-D1 TaxID=3046202 RepID=UPI0024BB3020|nr:hypothetical protein [Arthrobacter sp. H35-D1]MDJ0314792.1 hypothetical protein [Arthrobacter sp. H35-D1]
MTLPQRSEQLNEIFACEDKPNRPRQRITHVPETRRRTRKFQVHQSRGATISIGKAMATETKPTNYRSSMNRNPLFGSPVKHPLRVLPVIALAVAGAAHIPVIPTHLHEAPYIGVLFIVLTAASFVLATVLALHDVPAAYFGTAAVMGLAILGYVISRTIGLPQIGDDIGNWLEPLGVVAVIVEATACLSAVAIGFKARHQAGTHALSAR